MHMEEKYFTFFIMRNILPTNINRLFHRTLYLISDFFNKLMTGRKFCNLVLINYYRLLRQCANTPAITENRKVAGRWNFVLYSSIVRNFHTQLTKLQHLLFRICNFSYLLIFLQPQQYCKSFMRFNNTLFVLISDIYTVFL